MMDPGSRTLFQGRPRHDGDLVIPAEAGTAAPADAGWLGIVIDHHRLFDGLAAGWMFPSIGSGFLVGVGAYAANGPAPESGHRMPVFVRFDRATLPEIEVPVFAADGWTRRSLERVSGTDRFLYWPGALPTFGITGLSVATNDQGARLAALARQVSNVELPVEPQVVEIPEDDSAPPALPDGGVAGASEAPAAVSSERNRTEADAAHGAMSLAVWAVPRNDRWFDLLTATLSSDRTRRAVAAACVDAPWWEFPPWTPPPETVVCEGETALWMGALEVLGRRAGRTEEAETVAGQVAAVARRRGAPESQVADWLESTRAVLLGEEEVDLDRWRRRGVDLALQLALLRPEPAKFVAWNRDLPSLPPAVWWSAAALCGLACGYRSLDLRFRGNTIQRAVLAVQALRLQLPRTDEVRWPVAEGEANWRRESGDLVLRWGEREIARMAESSRGKWLSADLHDAAAREQACKIASELRWNCAHQEIRLDDERLSVSGPGELRVGDGGLVARGEVRLRLPDRVGVETVLDEEGFRRHIATSPGRIPAPVGLPKSPPGLRRLGIPGLDYLPDFLDEAEESRIVEEIDRGEWSSELSRRVQHYGWLYDYRRRTVADSMRLGELPTWAATIARRLVRIGVLPELPDQVIVNEYLGDQSISRHIDGPRFAEGIAMVSLLESWEMVFRRDDDQSNTRAFVLERGSVAVMTGEARYHWMHEIPKRKWERPPPGSGVPKRRRGRRLSLTFRKVLPPDRVQEPGDGPRPRPASGRRRARAAEIPTVGEVGRSG